MPTESEFVQWIIDQRKANQTVNQHWQNLVDLCYPCEIEYDFIVKVENIAPESHCVMPLLTKRYLDIPILNPTSENQTNVRYEHFFGNISAHQRLNIKQVYQTDCEMFDYDCNKF